MSTPDEGKLESAVRNDIASIFGRLDFTYVDRAEGAGTGADEPKTKKPYWMWMIAALLVLLAFETFLSQRFGHWK